MFLFNFLILFKVNNFRDRTVHKRYTESIEFHVEYCSVHQRMFYFSWKNSISSPTGPLQKATRTGNSGWDGITMSFGSTVIGYPASRTAFRPHHPSSMQNAGCFPGAAVPRHR